jgi:ABC-type Mn2+/Zn2+ transport system ATPase subunit
MKKTTRTSKKILIIAGPNGAGKTTFATESFMTIRVRAPGDLMEVSRNELDQVHD